MTFLITVLAIYSGIMLSVASFAGFFIFLRYVQIKKVNKAYALRSKPKESAKR